MTDLTAAECYHFVSEGCSDSEIMAYAAIRRDGRIGWEAYAQVRGWLGFIRQEVRRVEQE